MNIKLICPKMSLRPMDSEFKRRMSPSISLLIIAGLTPPEHRVTIEDENADNLHLNDHPDLVGITVNVDTSTRAYQIADHYRSRGIPVVLGGIHPSANPQEAAEHADAVCIGEAENIWTRTLKDAAQKRLNHIYYHDTPGDLSKTPQPAWELLKRERYLYDNIVVTSRGCPFTCDFCYNSCEYVHKKYRNRPISNIIEEIRSLKTRHVMFIDDNFIGNPKWTYAFLDAIEPMGLTWNAAVSVNIGRFPQLVRRMKETGCRSLFIGFETINAEALRTVTKTQNRVEDYERTIRLLHDHAIMINASLAFGFDTDEPSVFDTTLEWLVRNRIETMTAHILTPYPGTRVYQKLLEEGRIIDTDWSHYNTAHVVFQPERMTADELYQGYLNIYKRFYSFRNILRRMPKKRKQRLPYLLFNFGYRKFGNFFSKLVGLNNMAWFGRLGRKLAYGID